MSLSAGRAAVFAVFFPFVWLYRKVFRKQWRAIDDAYRADNARDRAAEMARAERRSDPGPASPGKKSKGKSKGKGKGRGKKKQSAAVTSEPVVEPAAEPGPATRYDWRPVCILIVVAIALTIKEYFGKRTEYMEYFPYDATDIHWRLGQYVWTSGFSVACYALIPLLTVVLMPGERVRDYYVRLGGLRKHAWLYAMALVAMAVVIAFAKSDDSFYGFYLLDDRLNPRSPLDFWVWLVTLPLEFLALEFLFRGFMLHGLRRSFGSKAIFVMMVPYCMIHHIKPFPPFAEVLTALIAAVLLGTLAMRTRSILASAIVHMAASMTLTLADVDHLVLLAIAAPLLWLLRHRLLAAWRAIDDDYRREFTDEDAAERDGQKSDAPPAALPDALAPGPYDWRPLCVLFVVALSLSLQEGFGQRSTYREVFPPDGGEQWWQLGAFVWWSGWRVFGYIVLPVMAILLMPGERVRDYYVSFKGFFKHLWIYAVLFLCILPAVIIASRTEAFSRTYPFYKLANRSFFDFWAWEVLYVIQFLSLEFFFRGFMLHGLRRSMGSKAIFVMIVSYCMIHYGKPLPETTGAIFAGLILGTLSMRTRSIWGGVLIHAGVAVTMDALALQHCPSAESGLPCKGH